MKVINADTGASVSDVVVMTTIIAPEKTSHTFGPHFTDPRGEVRFTREEIQRQVNLNLSMGLMEYCCGLEQATGIIVTIASLNEIEGIIRGAAYWESAVPELRLTKEGIRRLRESPNRWIKPAGERFKVPAEGAVLTIRVSAVSPDAPESILRRRFRSI